MNNLSNSRTDAPYLYHADNGPAYYQRLDDTAGRTHDTNIWNDTTPGSSTFTLGASSRLNTSGATYGFWLFSDVTGVQKITSFTTDSGGSAIVTLGFKMGMGIWWPQSASGDRIISDGKINVTDSWTQYGTLNNSLGEQTWPSTLATVANTQVTFGGLLANTTYLYYATAK